MDIILKNLTDSKIIVQDTLEKREHRNRLVEEDDEDNFREPDGIAAAEADADDDATPHEEREEIKPRRTAAQRAGRRKAMSKQ